MKRGFTLIELSVIISILALLSSLLILYSRDSEKQLRLVREKAKLIGAILRAKALSVQTYKQEEAVCGYGVHFDAAEYRIFKDPKVAGSCDGSNKVWDGIAEDVEVINLTDTNVMLFTSPAMTDIFFTPPDPKVLLSPGNLSSSNITLSVTVGAVTSSTTISVNNAGQVSTQ